MGRSIARLFGFRAICRRFFSRRLRRRRPQSPDRFPAPEHLPIRAACSARAAASLASIRCQPRIDPGTCQRPSVLAPLGAGPPDFRNCSTAVLYLPGTVFHTTMNFMISPPRGKLVSCDWIAWPVRLSLGQGERAQGYIAGAGTGKEFLNVAGVKIGSTCAKVRCGFSGDRHLGPAPRSSAIRALAFEARRHPLLGEVADRFCANSPSRA